MKTAGTDKTRPLSFSILLRALSLIAERLPRRQSRRMRSKRHFIIALAGAFCLLSAASVFATSDLNVSGTVQFSGTGALVSGAIITGYSDSGLTMVDNSQGTGGGTTTSAANGTWTLHLLKNTTRYVVVSGLPSGTNSASVVLGTNGANPVQISNSEIQFTSGSGG